jgi:hypothetical protein
MAGHIVLEARQDHTCVLRASRKAMSLRTYSRTNLVTRRKQSIVALNAPVDAVPRDHQHVMNT